MAACQHIAQVRLDALSDPHISPQAVAVAATMITGGDLESLGFPSETIDLALWELKRTGHSGGERR